MSRLTTDQNIKRMQLPPWEGIAAGLFALSIWQISANLEFVASPYILSQKFAGLVLEGDPLYNLTLLQMLGTSLTTLLAGAGSAFIVAIPLGILMGYFRGLSRFLNVYISLCRPIPPMAWIPVGYILFAGMPQPTLWVQIMVVFVGAFFPSFTATAHAVQSVDPILIEAAQTLGARHERQILCKVLLPSVVPAVISGIRSGLGVGWMCIIGAEFVGGRMGIGAYIWSLYTIGGRMSEIMIAILCVGIVGFMMNEGISLIGRRIARWYSW
ncbi:MULTISPECIES: ABC transporter permease [Desulfitobacterium]|uniref:ABC-type nitrate/sulfonate/bicarbonate transport system, permease component n=1 Tax=Desulfitobacterium dehalogenans (strain ATCC 51507 / DSM 9161 / JW/IU-DC1) TaxID=756499 RepID=I4A5J9_DESDJ|nr:MULTISPECIES: ABC transporter permease [Desulfitobacterium]AFL99233.1 ABC-type nitrate/sulfonate/bicarbonate transport system, permease component [Desulfitobacterium dehalogenans ATCC 51507]